MKLDPLFQPINLGPVTLRNRAVVTAHALNQTGFGHIMGDRSFDYYEERARGGVGLVVTEAQMVHISGRGATPHSQDGWRPESVAAYEELAERVHRHGAKVFGEIGHMGALDSNTMHLDNYRALYSPSGIAPLNTVEMPKPMEQEDLDAVLEGFVQTASNVKAGGLDGVEIHAAHGFLLALFLSPSANKRTDRYGGSTEGRCRYIVDIADAVRSEVGPDFPIGVRLSFEEFIPDGVHEDEGERIVKTLRDTGLFDYFSISGGTTLTSHKLVSPMREGPGLLEPFAARAKRILGPDVPVLAANQIASPEHAAQIIGEGVTDLVAMARAHLADPFLISKAEAGEVDAIRECVHCNQGCFGRLVKFRPITCTINPASGREATWGKGTIAAAEEPRKVVVVGGGPAGLKLAEVASARGHEVVLFEKADEIGGNVCFASRLPKRDRWSLLIKNFEYTLAAGGVDIRLGAEATPGAIRAEDPDAVVFATGASFDRDGYSALLGFREGIPNLDRTTVLDPVEAIAAPDRCGQKVVIVDDSTEYLPLGLAEMLAEAGKEVEIVSHLMMVGGETIDTLDLGSIYPRISELGVKVTAQHLVADIGDEEAEIASIWGNSSHTTPIDSLVLVMSRSPRRDLFDAVDGTFDGELHRIGDCLAARHIDEAIYEGEKLGRAL